MGVIEAAAVNKPWRTDDHRYSDPSQKTQMEIIKVFRYPRGGSDYGSKPFDPHSIWVWVLSESTLAGGKAVQESDEEFTCAVKKS